MLLSITLTEPPATDLGYLLHKHPDRLQSFAVSAGQAHVFYPEAAEQRCTAALLLEIDPIALVRGHRRAGAAGGGPEAFSLAEYVNDRPYAASSMLAVAMGKVFRTAMTGRCDARPDLAARTLPLEIAVPALSCRGGGGLAERLLRPLGWDVQATRPAGCAASRCTGTPPGRPTSSGCRSAIRGPTTTAAGPWCCTGIRLRPTRSGSTTPCAWTPAACLAAG
jgi:3' terminal RNA ribose 2'-O-methyltransferase Hen1